MSETYEEVVRRNEPKNYTVRWDGSNGSKESSVGFESFEEADMFADTIRTRDYVQNVRVLRSGRHPSSKKWTPSRRDGRIVARRTREELQEVTINEEAWALPAGFVDGDADKHGPAVAPKTDNRMPARSVAEKAQWARENNWQSRMIGI